MLTGRQISIQIFQDRRSKQPTCEQGDKLNIEVGELFRPIVGRGTDSVRKRGRPAISSWKACVKTARNVHLMQQTLAVYHTDQVIRRERTGTRKVSSSKPLFHKGVVPKARAKLVVPPRCPKEWKTVIEQCWQLAANGSCAIGSKCAFKHGAAVAKGEGERDTRSRRTRPSFPKPESVKKDRYRSIRKTTSLGWNITFFGLSVLSLSLLVWECFL